MTAEEVSAIQAVKAGDIEGLGILILIHQQRAIAAAFAIVRDQAVAEDVVADAFIAVYDNIAQYDPSRPFAPWFYRIVTNGALKAAKRSRRFRCAPAEWEMRSPGSDSSISPEAEAVRGETRDSVAAAIAQLPAGQRAAIVLRYYLDFDEREMAEILRIPRGTVKWRLFAARRQLRESLMDYQRGPAQLSADGEVTCQ